MGALLLTLCLAAGPDAPDVAVVCPEPLRAALGPWREYRAAQGHRVAVVSSAGTVEDIRTRLRELAAGGKLRYVVLVGDADSTASARAADFSAQPVEAHAAANQPVEADAAANHAADTGATADHTAVLETRVPAAYVPARVVARWGSGPVIATDNAYADLDGDGKPELAVGRLAVDEPGELKAVVDKILAYERSTDTGPWRRQINVVAGVGGFGVLADRVLESAARYFLTQHVPADYRVSMTYASWHSPYCPDPRRFGRTTLERLNEGAWFWVYIGHGGPTELDRVRVPGGWQRILAPGDLDRLDCRHGRPIAVLLACETGAFDWDAECLAEQMLRHPRGPVAVVAGSRVSMPYGMTVLSQGLMEQCFRRRVPTLGLAVLRAKQAMLDSSSDHAPQRAMLDTLARAFSPPPVELETERFEHVHLFNLLGDPLLRLRYVEPVALEVPERVQAGQALRVRGTSSVDGHATVELVLPRGTLGFPRPRRDPLTDDPAELARFQEVYEWANDLCLGVANVEVAGGRFEAVLAVPRACRGKCHVRVFVAGPDGFATGSAEVLVSVPQPVPGSAPAR